MDRYVCIHGHYYQPPRENPWLEEIEAQVSAYPYHDWNERIAAECYGPNGAARILGPAGRITQITNNYARTSFNFGPTLLSWLEEKAPHTYTTIIEGDRESRERFSGHGSAMAQVYNHMILPLASSRDRRTQIIWGLRDFEHRFGRAAEGMWLPETAVDVESLEILAEHGVRFTVLAPRQAGRVRRATGGGAWRDVSGGRIDPTRAYQQRLPSGRRIALFFYDGPISQGVAFEGLLRDGAAFAARLMSAFNDQRRHAQLAHVATDGESYGHHHRFGEMALAFAVDKIESEGLAKLTNYGEFLELLPPQHLVEVVPNTSWSCYHGIERWRADCGCSSGGYPAWNQAWREPLRNALDWLRDELAPLFEREGAALFNDPWKARDAYIAVVLDRTPDNVARFFAAHANRELDEAERTRALKLLELQRHAMLMYTSCGWFFDDLGGIETVQVIQYAGRCVQLARELFGADPEQRFLELLGQARSNVPSNGSGADIYLRIVGPAAVDLKRVGAHYAINSLFESSEGPSRVYCYEITPHDYQTAEAGRVRAAAGHATVTSVITGEQEHVSFGVLHLGDHVVNGGVREFADDARYAEFKQELMAAISRTDLTEAVRVLDRHFAPLTYSLQSLFQDQRVHILRRILEPVLAEADTMNRAFYERNAPLMRYLTETRSPMPQRLLQTAELALNTALLGCFEEESIDTDRVQRILADGAATGVALDVAGLSLAVTRAVDRLAGEWAAEPRDLERLSALESLVALTGDGSFTPNLWRAQNTLWHVAREHVDGSVDGRWLDTLHRLGTELNIALPERRDLMETH